MERLGLDKFKDVVVDKEKLNSIRGGGSMSSESCHTQGGWLSSDEQTDYYFDDNDDGCYEYGGYFIQHYLHDIDGGPAVRSMSEYVVI